jgi:hypothetical protein
MEVRRATLEDVQKNQENLIHGTTGLDVLIKQNGIIQPQERATYFKLLAFSLLGKGLKYRVELNYHGNIDDLGSVSSFSRQLAYYTNKEVTINLKGGKILIPIGLLWEALRNALYEPMDQALDDAIHISKERDIIRPGKGASMDDIRR